MPRPLSTSTALFTPCSTLFYAPDGVMGVLHFSSALPVLLPVLLPELPLPLLLFDLVEEPRSLPLLLFVLEQETGEPRLLLLLLWLWPMVMLLPLLRLLLLPLPFSVLVVVSLT